MSNIFTAQTNILSGANFCGKTNTVISVFGLFLHHHGFAAGGHRCAGHNADAGSRRPFPMKRLTGKGFTCDSKRQTGLQIR
ncbi:hypothetical protein D3C73_966920 [compost metagenome]